MSGDILGCRDKGRESVTGVWCVGARDAAKHLTTHRMVSPLPPENYLALNVNRVTLEKPWYVVIKAKEKR